MLAVLASGLVALPAGEAWAATSRCASLPPISASGGNTTYSADTTGALQSWGDNYFGTLGRGSFGGYTKSPAPIPSSTSTVSVAAGGYHTLQLRSDGSVWAWGWNEAGQLGEGTVTNRSTPTRVANLSDVVTIAAGLESSFAIKRDGTLWAWGRNSSGQLGDGSTTNRLVPVQVAISNVTEVAAGAAFTLALRADGKVLSFGRNSSVIQLGRGAANTTYPTPAFVTGLGTITAVSASGADVSGHSLALRDDGTVWAWGYNAMGQLGINNFSDRASPAQVSGLSGVTAISAGGYFSLARKSDGTAWSWGQNTYGELANPSAPSYQSTPVQATGLSGVAGIDAGGNHSIALATTGGTLTWGRNSEGGIGDGTTTTRTTPYQTSVTQSAPAVPPNLEATPGEKLVYLTWSAPAGVVADYQITPYVGGVAQPPISTSSTELSYTVRNLSEGTNYSFTIAGQNCVGTGAASARSARVVPTGVQLNEEGFKVEGQRLTDRMSASVNTFNGNLRLEATDLRLAGTGLDLVVARAWSSRSTGESIFGKGWVATLGDVRVQTLNDGSVFYYGPGGAQSGFGRNDDGTFAPSAGLSASLRLDDNATPGDTSDDTYVLTTDGGGEQQVFDRAAGRLIRRRDRNANTISFGYGPTGLLTAVTDTQGRSTTVAYNAQGLVSVVTDPAGRQHSYLYDANKNLTSYTDPENGYTARTYFAYDTSGRLIQVTTPAGRQMVLGYDTLRKVTSIRWTATGWPTTTFVYSADKTVVTDPNAKATTYRYDPVGRTTGVTDALGNATSIGYTSRSNVRTYAQPTGTTTYGYTSVNALASVAYPTGSSAQMQYGDPAHPHLPTAVADPQGNRQLYAYDTVGNLRTQQAEGMVSPTAKVELTYGAKGRIVSSRDPNGSTTTYTYDSLGRPTGATPPAPQGAVGPITYDGLSRPTSMQNATGETTTTSYDRLDRITRMAFADGSSVTWGHDRDGNVTTMTDPTGTTVMSYDEMGRLSARTTPDDKTVTYGYDKAGNLTAVTDSNGTTTYAYNAINLPVQVTAPDGRSTTMTYDASYNRTSLNHPNGIAVTSTYDSSNRVTQFAFVKGTTTLRRTTYSYLNPDTFNSDGQLRYRATEADGTRTMYSYDRLNRLERARTETASGGYVSLYSYSYDGMGNAKIRAGDNSSIDYIDDGEFDAASRLARITRFEGSSIAVEDYSHDPVGRMTGSSRGASFSYNTTGQTTSISPRTGDGLPIEAVYRGVGQAERVAVGPVARNLDTPVVCPGIGCVDPDPTIAPTTFGYTSLGLSSATTAGITTTWVRDPAGGLLSQQTPTSAQYLLTDPAGTVLAVADQNGALTATYTYDPFGGVAATTGDPSITPWRIAGAHQDPTGLYKIGERYYDPTLGRFTQPDPIHNPLDPKLWNPYTYVGNDPINYTDPSGLSWWRDLACEVKTIVGAVVFTGAVFAAIASITYTAGAAIPLWAKVGYIAMIGITTVGTGYEAGALLSGVVYPEKRKC